MKTAIEFLRWQREWVCVYCDAHGPAGSEDRQRLLTQRHMAECKARALYMARIARAMAAMGSDAM